MRYNIFQGSDNLKKTVATSLGYDVSRFDEIGFTRDIYFESYFYLCNRFGNPRVVDDYKKIMIWNFKVKNYDISVELNSSWLSFIVFGKYHLQPQFRNPYWLKLKRERLKNKELLITHLDSVEERSEYEAKQLQNLFDEFQLEKNFPDDISNDEFNEKYGFDFWHVKINKFNNNILGVKYEDYEKYGEHSNSETRHALKTLNQFIKNLLTPIWVRDCPFNIKGRLTDNEAYSLNRYENNIKIAFQNSLNT